MPEFIVLERRLDPPIALEDVARMDREAAWCMEHHRVRHTTSLLSADGRRLLCAFVAADAEAVRNVLRQFEIVPVRLWSATEHGPPEPPVGAPLARGGDELVAVARTFDEPVELQAIQDIEDRAAWCLEQHQVRFVRTWFARDRRSMLCLYAAPDAESVRSVQQRSRMPFTEVWTVRVFLSER